MPHASEFKKLGKLSITDPKKALSFAVKKAYKDDRKTGLSIIDSI